MHYRITNNFDGWLLRDLLRTLGVSSSLLTRLKQDEQGIMLNGAHVTVRATVRTGDLLELAIEDREPPAHIQPSDLPLSILAQSPDWMVLNKPHGMPTHPSHGHFCDTLANALAFHFEQRGEVFRPRFINRLDRDTTGAVLVARHALSASALSAAMARGEIQKSYFALVHGELSGSFEIESGIRRVRESIITREACPVGEGDYAKTAVEPLATHGGVTLVQLFPQTGRTHQLRVHMAHVGHPLLGDGLYGIENDGFARHALHAATLSFPTLSGDRVSVKAPMPQDMMQKIAEMGKEVEELV